MYKRELQGWQKHWDFILMDVIVQQLALLIAIALHLGLASFKNQAYLLIAILGILLNLIVSAFFNSFHNALKRGIYKEFTKTVKHCTLILLGVMLCLFAMHSSATYSRIVIFSAWAFHIAAGYGVRLLYRFLRKKYPNKNNRSVLVITTKEFAARAISILKSDITNTISIKGIVIIDEKLTGELIDGVQIVSDKESVCNYACREWISEIFLYYPLGMTDEINELYSLLMQSGITVHLDWGSLTQFENMEHQIERFGSSSVLTLSLKSTTPFEKFEKRLMDIMGGLVGSIMALIIMAIIAIPLKKQSPGPLLYTSERIGMYGKRFKMLKIRSMYLDADERKKELMAQNRVADGMMFKLDWDPRIIGNETLPDGTHKTGIGEFIRKTSLDEFPQFFNVLKGDMSLVGTRPPTPDEWEKYELHHRSRMATKPGITGMWQVSGRSEITDFEEVVRLDNEYISNWTPGLDWRILFKTVEVVLKKRGAM